MNTARTSTQITFSVWKALFLREAVSRISTGRAAWFWLLAEPVFHVTYMLVIFTVIRVKNVGGIDITIWLMVGMLSFFMFRNTGTQAMNAISANQALFTYRQVKPVDTLLVRGGLEGMLLILVASVLLTGAALFGYPVFPADMLAVLEAFFGLWLVGMGFGLVTSVGGELVPELDKVVKFLMMPLYMISGVIFPITLVPQPFRDWLMLNPVAHGIEAARLGFVRNYNAVPELNIAYLYGFALVLIFLGLALHRRFAMRLTTL